MFFLSHIWLIPLLPACGAALMFFFRPQAAEIDRQRGLRRRGGGGVSLSCVRSGNTPTTPHDNPGKPYQTILYTWLGSDDVGAGVSPVQPRRRPAGQTPGPH